MVTRVFPAACLPVLVGASLLSSCAAGVRPTAEVPGDTPVPVSAPPTVDFQASAPDEVVSDAARARRRTVVGDMLRLGTITAFEQGPMGILRTAVGETFDTSNTRDLQYTRLALAYSGWTTPGTALVIELWDDGQKIGEFTEGAFLIGPQYTTPVNCAGPSPSGICGYGAGGAPQATAAQAPAAPQPTSTAGVPASSRPTGHSGLHLNLGLGAGAADLTCEGCDYPSNTALSGYLGLGAALGETMVLGVESTGWATDEFDTDARVYSLMAAVTNYLDAQSGIFLTTGIGLIGYREQPGGLDLTGKGIGYSARLGYELRTVGRLTLAPYVGFISTFGAVEFKLEGDRTGEFNINNLQAGVAIGVN
jgi:hypothetical protein